MTTEQKVKYKELTVLFVDDEKLIIEAMNDILPVLFKKAFFALNGIEAIEIYNDNKIDIIITDLNMPKMGGLEMLSYIKTINKEQKTLFVSGHNEVEIIKESKDLCDAYIVKPISYKVLFQALEKIF